MLGYLLAIGFEAAVELSFWAIKKTASGVYYLVYGDGEEEHQKTKLTEEEIEKLKLILNSDHM
ncbi:MAG: hypothetical protein ACR2M6_04420 [Vampirovibrionia bacterium]|jgi:hypothetical protein